jgi:F-box-like
MLSQERSVYRPRGTSCGWPDLPTEIYLEIARYLSRDDALNLRLVCRDFSIPMMGAVFGSVVVPFGKAMYDINSTSTKWERKPPPGSMFEKYGLAIRKFGIAFEADPSQLTGDRPDSKGSDENDL